MGRQEESCRNLLNVDLRPSLLVTEMQRKPASAKWESLGHLTMQTKGCGLYSKTHPSYLILFFIFCITLSFPQIGPRYIFQFLDRMDLIG